MPFNVSLFDSPLKAIEKWLLEIIRLRHPDRTHLLTLKLRVSSADSAPALDDFENFSITSKQLVHFSFSPTACHCDFTGIFFSLSL